MAREMNEIERKFYDAFVRCTADDDGISIFTITPQTTVGIYIADFVIETDEAYDNKTYVVEIDGHESHKTKEQRYKDYVRERFFISKGYTVIRFTGSEVFVDADRCAVECNEIMRAGIARIENIHNCHYQIGVLKGCISDERSRMRMACDAYCNYIDNKYSTIHLALNGLPFKDKDMCEAIRNINKKGAE